MVSGIECTHRGSSLTTVVISQRDTGQSTCIVYWCKEISIQKQPMFISALLLLISRVVFEIEPLFAMLNLINSIQVSRLTTLLKRVCLWHKNPPITRKASPLSAYISQPALFLLFVLLFLIMKGLPSHRLVTTLAIMCLLFNYLYCISVIIQTWWA